jgi:hypothetical protein
MLPLIQAKYIARACGAPSWAQAKSGNWQVAIPFTVSAGEHTGETITWIGVMHDTTDKNGVSGHERVVQSLQYMGWQGDEIAELAELTDEQAIKIFTEDVELSCAPELYDGKTRLKVQWVNKVGAGRFTFKEAATKNDLKSFSAQMKNTIRGMQHGNRQNGTSAKPKNPTHPNAPGNDDDLPF